MRKKDLLLFLVVNLVTLAATAIFAETVKSRNLEFDYEVYLKDIPADANRMEGWLPIMPDKDYQIIEEVSLESTPLLSLDSLTIREDSTYKNKILHFSLKRPFQSTYQFNIHYKLKRLEQANKPWGGLSLADKKTGLKEDLTKYLKANTLVTISPEVKEIAKKVTEGKETTLEKARAIYDYVYANVKYDKDIPGWGQGDTQRVCRVGAGNCTDFHSLFISLSRASGIPAKFIMGVPLEDKVAGEYNSYHCWAQFYDNQMGWIPVDISEAWKNKSKYEYYFGEIDEDRVEFTQGRDIILNPINSGDPLNYFIFPYVEIDGKKHKGVGISFKYKNQGSEIVKQKTMEQLTKVERRQE